MVDTAPMKSPVFDFPLNESSVESLVLVPSCEEPGMAILGIGELVMVALMEYSNVA